MMSSKMELKVCPHEDTIIAGNESPVCWCAPHSSKTEEYTKAMHFTDLLDSYTILHVPTVKSRSEVVNPNYFMRKLLFK